MEYLKRYIERDVADALKTSGVVVVAGPKFCGKTETCKRFAKSKIALDEKGIIGFADADPRGALMGDTPRLIDEWQNVPNLWNVARSEVDRREEKFGQFIFTGSSTPADMDEIFHSGAGRIVTVLMRTMSLYESKESSGAVSLKELFGGKKKIFFINEDYGLRDTAFYICRGGWPMCINMEKEIALKITRNYCSTLFDFENSKNKKFRNKKPELFRLILRSYARNISTEARAAKILNDTNAHEGRSMAIETLDEYLRALHDLFILKDIEAWNPNFRSKTAIISSPTRHFVDTSIAANAIHISVDDLLNDPKTFGFFFEDFAVKELSIYAQALGGEIRHFRDANGLECDAVMHLENGEYALIEIKEGSSESIEYGASRLRLLKKKIVANGQKEPSFCMVLTACGHALTRADGIHVAPINSLKD